MAVGSSAVSCDLNKSTVFLFTGYVEPQFEGVVKLFRANFERGLEIGAAVAVCHKGKLVVDLAGGTLDRNSTESYSVDTLQPVFSVSKGITALVANMLADRDLLDLDAPVARYWPQFAQTGKSEIPVKWLLTHQSGLLGLDRSISHEQLLDWGVVNESLAAQSPDWEPGSNHGNHSITYGFLVGEVVHRVSRLTVGQYLSREIAGPLRADLFIGLSKEREARVSPVFLPELMGPQRLADSCPYAARTLSWISPPLAPLDMNRSDIRGAEISAANGIANARSLATGCWPR